MKWHRIFAWVFLSVGGFFLLMTAACFFLPVPLKGMGAYLLLSFFIGASGWIVGDF
jgi:hypothetical protein